MSNFQRILVLAPHTDDGELGCGGSIARFAGEQKEIFYAAFCLCASSLPEGLARDTLAKECRQATEILGIPGSNLMLFDYEVRELPQSRQQILEEMRNMYRNLRPDLVMLPSATDIHQDHRVVHEEGLRAFKHTSIVGYELPWNNYHFHTGFFTRLNEDHLSRKVQALRAYKSQVDRAYMREEFTRSLALVRGAQVDARFAEAFEVYRWLV